MVDQNALRSFVLAAETLNFSVAAEQRNTVQSAVSAHIAKLEADLGRQLFVRGRGKAMSLTPEGASFLLYARRILALSEEAVQAIQTAHSRRILRLGTTVSLALSLLPDVLSRFAAAQPDIQIHVGCERSDGLLAQLDRDEIDVAFMMDQGRRAERCFVHSQPLVWAAGDGFELSGDEVVPLAFLADGRDLRHYALEALDAAGRQGTIAHLSTHPIGVRAFVQAGLAVTVMPISTVVAPLKVVPPEIGLPPLAPIALSAYRQSGKTDEAVSLLAGLLEEAATDTS